MREVASSRSAVLVKVKGCVSHYLERPLLGFILNISPMRASSRTSHSSPANKEEMN
jgi:hypothetical protein